MKLAFVLYAAIFVASAVADSLEANATVLRIDEAIEQVKGLIANASEEALKIDPANYHILDPLFNETRIEAERLTRIYEFHAEALIGSYLAGDLDRSKCRKFIEEYLRNGAEALVTKVPLNFLRHMVTVQWAGLLFRAKTVVAAFNSSKVEAQTSDLSAEEFYNEKLKKTFDETYLVMSEDTRQFTDEMMLKNYAKEMQKTLYSFKIHGKEVLEQTYSCVLYGKPMPE